MRFSLVNKEGAVFWSTVSCTCSLSGVLGDGLSSCCSFLCTFSGSLCGSMWRDSARLWLLPTGRAETDFALEMFIKLLVHFSKLQIFSLSLYLFSLVTDIFLSIWEGKKSFCNPNYKNIVFLFGQPKKYGTRNKWMLVNEFSLITSTITLCIISALFLLTLVLPLIFFLICRYLLLALESLK